MANNAVQIIRRRATPKKKRRYHKPGMRLPLTAILGFAPLIGNGVAQVKANGWNTGLKNTVSYVIPYNPNTGRFTASNLGGGLLPILIGFATHYLIGSKLGVNRMLGRMGIPFVRL
jgi:hypothetical protein